ncbi:MAG: coproporphyrinogen III oxidase family protein, partial [Clostridia bacterium]|nr:coproporphyrinogen III oxidase family protein [Clostridia bacterium]
PMVGEKELSRLLDAARTLFDWQGGEITCEVNPGSGYPVGVEGLAKMGVNRISVGLQSSHAQELSLLGRTHTAKDVERLLNQAVTQGISNYSVDLMWGIPEQTVASALESVDFALSLNPTHISAYMLKVEQDTPFGKMGDQLILPSEDTVCEIYEQSCAALEEGGLSRYEISNFAKKGFESKHNCKYWNCEETLGLGPAAHSFMEGERFYYPRDIQGFMAGTSPVEDGTGGDFAEYAMLQLRMSQGLRQKACMERFGHGIPDKMLAKAKPFVSHGLMVADPIGLRMTLKGNLVSNAILAAIL